MSHSLLLVAGQLLAEDMMGRKIEVTRLELSVPKLRRLGLTRLQPRPYHPKKDAAAQEAFKKTSRPS